jgi:predicted RNase H-like HicB family nuclease
MAYLGAMFTAVFQKSGAWWAAYVEEVPGVNTQGATLEEARANLREALTLILAANRELARREEPPGCIREALALPA